MGSDFSGDLSHHLLQIYVSPRSSLGSQEETHESESSQHVSQFQFYSNLLGLLIDDL